MFQDREDAGRILAEFVRTRHFENPFLLALPRGGVVLAKQMAPILRAPYDVVVARKIGAPGNPEFGIGAISEDEIPYIAPEYRAFFDAQSPALQQTVRREIEELRRRIRRYRSGNALPSLAAHTAIVVDDGLATGVTAIAAGKYLRGLGPRHLVLAVPVAPDDYPADLLRYYDEVLSPNFSKSLGSVGAWYRSFKQVEDAEVLAALGR